MTVTKTVVNSAGTNLDGFLYENKFIAAEPLANYLTFEFNGHEELNTTQFSIKAIEQSLELLVIYGGYALPYTQPKLTRFRAQLPPPTVPSISNYPDNVLFDIQGTFNMPHFFPSGLIVPKGTSFYLETDASTSNLTLITKPALLQTYKPIISTP